MSADGVRPARSFKRWALVAVLAATACLGNLDEASVGVTSPRYLDELCAADEYTLAGNAVRTTGITSDSCGFVLGPGAGSVSFDISGEQGGFESYEVSALVRRDGHTAWETLGGAGPYGVSSDSERIEVLDVRLRGVFSSTGCD